MYRVKNEIAGLLSEASSLPREQIEGLLEFPPEPEMGDLAFPCFNLAPQWKQNPAKIAEQLLEKVKTRPGRYWSRVENRGPYLNFFLDYTILAGELFKEITSRSYVSQWCNRGDGAAVVIDYSAPNIAKPFGIGHLRSTVIGNALYRIYQATGFNPVGINHLGDWGTQFGKLIAAYQWWGNPREMEKKPVDHAYDLYVRFHQEAKEDESLEDAGRLWFRKLEEGEPEAVELWEKFCDYSLQEFKRIYRMLGIHFDAYQGESFYNQYLEKVVQEALEKGVARESQEAIVVDLENYDLPVCILRKKDGGTLYVTRDLAAAIYRYQQYRFDRMLYVVGSEQSLHFQQLFKVLELMGYEWANRCNHVPFGLIRFKDGKMSSREGKIILLKEVIEKSISLAYQVVEEKNPQLENKEEVARAVGIGAIKFGDLYNDRIKDIDFEWEKVLDFSGETAPYVQYAHARVCSILRKAKASGIEYNQGVDLLYSWEKEEERSLLKQLSLMPDRILKSQDQHKPSLLARYLIDVARDFNRFYHHCQVLGAEDKVCRARLEVIKATRMVLQEGLELLGIEAPEEM